MLVGICAQPQKAVHRAFFPIPHPARPSGHRPLHTRCCWPNILHPTMDRRSPPDGAHSYANMLPGARFLSNRLMIVLTAVAVAIIAQRYGVPVEEIQGTLGPRFREIAQEAMPYMWRIPRVQTGLAMELIHAYMFADHRELVAISRMGDMVARTLDSIRSR